MRTMLIAAALLTATPALADWPPTKWGMTPEQVVAVVPGAVQNERSETADLWGLHRLAEARTVDGAFNVRVRFYFGPRTRKLEMLDMLPVNMDECPAYREAMVARYGDTGVDRGTIPIAGSDRVTITLRWTDPANGDSLSFSGIFFEGSETEYGICKTIRSRRS